MSSVKLEALARDPRVRETRGFLTLPERDPGSADGERPYSEEPLDFSILREYSGEQSPMVGIDPRISPESIARRLHLSPATVRRRLTSWRTRGFLRGFDVIPNPSLLGGRLAARLLDFANPIDQERAVAPLSWIDGMVQIDIGPTQLLAVYLVASPAESGRRFRQLQSVDGVRAVGPELVFEFPPCARRMSRTDWRLVAALRLDPEASLGDLAGRIGQSTRATSRRYHALLDEGAVIFDPILDYSRFDQTLAVLKATVRPPELVGETERKIRALHPQSIRLLVPSVEAARATCGTVSLWVTAPTTAEVDQLSARIAHLPGVSDVSLWYERSIVPARAWLDERIESLLGTNGLAPPPVRN
jgi:DNA-binding Lrp family transcriptional regulator